MRTLPVIVIGLSLAGCVSTRTTVVDDASWSQEMADEVNEHAGQVDRLVTGVGRVDLQTVPGIHASSDRFSYVDQAGRRVDVAASEIREIVITQFDGSEWNVLIGLGAGAALGALIGYGVGSEGCGATGWDDLCLTRTATAELVGLAGGFWGLLIGSALAGDRIVVYRFGDNGGIAVNPMGLSYRMQIGR